MLITDSDIVTSADLDAIEPQASTTAATEKPPIDLPTLINRTVEECGEDLMSRFQSYSGILMTPGIGSAHAAAVDNIGSTSTSRPRFRLNQVVALGPDPSMRLVKRWLIYSALYELYRAASSRYLKANDRFDRKLKIFSDERANALDRLLAAGIPLVFMPLPCPGAVREPGAGTFAAGAVTHGGTGSLDPGGIWYVAITWTGAGYVSPANPAQSESGPSATLNVTTLSGEVLSVSIAGLNPPGLNPINVGTADGIYTQIAAAGWNVYVGKTAATLFLQNTSGPLPIATTSYTLPAAPVQSGAVLGVGQWPDRNFAFVRTRFRA